MLANLIIALLSKTYNMFDSNSNGLFLKKILSKRDELTDDEFCGSFLMSLPPIDCLQLFIVPFAVTLKYGSPLLGKMNKIMTLMKYVIFMSILFVIFVAISVAMIPLSWLKGIADKIQTENHDHVSHKA